MPFVSDTFDVETEAAVEAFQKLMGLDADGTVGRDTWNALTEEYKKVYAQAKEAGQNYNFDREYASFRKMSPGPLTDFFAAVLREYGQIPAVFI